MHLAYKQTYGSQSIIDQLTDAIHLVDVANGIENFNRLLFIKESRAQVCYRQVNTKR